MTPNDDWQYTASADYRYDEDMRGTDDDPDDEWLEDFDTEEDYLAEVDELIQQFPIDEEDLWRVE